MYLESVFSVPFRHRLFFTQETFHLQNAVLAEVLPPGSRVLAFVDQGVIDTQHHLPDQIRKYAQTHELLLCNVISLPGGETCKNDRHIFDNACQAIHEAGLDRQSYVLVVGGGAVLDVAGFAASVVHRGVRLVRVPSTTLAQADSGVGVKNGINAFGQKNLLGTFTPPWAVIADVALLHTLADEDWRSGFAEAVKVAAIKDAVLYDRIAADACRIRDRDESATLPVLQRSAELHFQHIVTGCDPFEMTSARPLDFGHWAAHKLEQMTGFSLRHGHAVAIGIALDVTYSSLTGLLDASTAAQIRQTLHNLGLPIRHPGLQEADTLLAGLEDFRRHLGGQLTITLLTGIGKPLDVHKINVEEMRKAMQLLTLDAF